MSTAAAEPVATPAVPGFEARDITGTVRDAFVPDAQSSFAKVTLTDGRIVTGEWDADDLPAIGCSYRFFGVWTVHDRHGQQFRCDTSVLDGTPTSQAGVVAYLSRSGLGLSHRIASKLWAAYGVEAVNVCRNLPESVADEGIVSIDLARTVAAKLRDDLDASPVKVALFELFASRGIPRGAVAACVRTWGANAPKVIRRDPFALIVADIPGIGFKRADALAADLGYPMHRLKRQMLAGWYALHTSSSGNTWESVGAFYAAVLKSVGSVGGIAAARYEDAIRLGVRAKWLRTRVGGDAAAALGGNPNAPHWVAEAGAAAAEERLARHVARVRRHAALWPSLADAEELSPHQREHAAAIQSSAVAILTGSPGTGKTFLGAALLRRIVATHGEYLVKVAAPTGKAAVRITEAMQRYKLPLKATTIHQLLEPRGRSGDSFLFARNEENPIEATVVVIDEKSMCDVTLAASLFAAIPYGCNVLLIGDDGQLSPVGHGAPLRDMLAANIPTAALSEIRRNAGAIVRACKLIREGKMWTPCPKVDLDAGENLVHLDATGDVEQLDKTIALLGSLRTKGFDPVWETQVLVPRNGGSAVGRKDLNAKLQAILNPLRDGDVQANKTFRVGDKVVCRKNSPEVKTVNAKTFTPDGGTTLIVNGDMGRVLVATKSAVVVQFLYPDRFVTLTTERRKKSDDDDAADADDAKKSGRAGDLELAYAITTHLSQGSEAPVIIVVLDDNAGPIGTRELIYTAISRAAKLCITVGSLRTAAKWIGKVGLGKRRTFLKELLTEGSAAPAVATNHQLPPARPPAFPGERCSTTPPRQEAGSPYLLASPSPVSPPTPPAAVSSPTAASERNGRHVSHITLLQLENFKRVKALTLTPKGAGVTEIRGRNSQGKSTCIDAAIAAFGGAKWAPEKPIRDGSEWAQIVAETPEYKITRRWWATDGDGKVGDKLIVEDRATGAAKRSPQTLLDKLVGVHAAHQYDPLRFLRGKPKEQAATMRQITGLDTSELDAERETVYALRTAANRDVATLRARLDVGGEPEPVPEPAAEIDITAMVREIEAASATRASNDAARRELDVVRGRIKVLQDELAGLLERERRGVAYCAALVDPDVVAIKGRADAAKLHNDGVRRQREHKANVDRMIDQVAALRQQHAEAVRVAASHDTRIKEIDAARLAALAKVTMPVPGMSIDGDMVTLNGVPFSQASQSQQIRTCFAIAAALSGELRTAFSHEGSLLDDDARADLDRWAVENDVQILLEVVGDDGAPGGIVIEDGRVRGDGGAERDAAKAAAREVVATAAVAAGNAVAAPF